MYRALTASVVSLVAAMLGACATTRPLPASLPTLPRVKPVESMQPCRVNLCTLRPEFSRLSEADQDAMELGCTLANSQAARECSIRQQRLADWIRSAP